MAPLSHRRWVGPLWKLVRHSQALHGLPDNSNQCRHLSFNFCPVCADRVTVLFMDFTPILTWDLEFFPC